MKTTLAENLYVPSAVSEISIPAKTIYTESDTEIRNRKAAQTFLKSKAWTKSSAPFAEEPKTCGLSLADYAEPRYKIDI